MRLMVFMSSLLLFGCGEKEEDTSIEEVGESGGAE
jgi:hypothetical protein